jgi:hypothetical protein
MNRAEKRLIEILERLPPGQAEQLLDYGEFLLARHGTAAPAAPEAPLAIPRPREESVVLAIKRLRASYPMLDAGELLHEASALMSEHVLRGRAAIEVIDELEALFERHYHRLSGGE